MWVDENCTKPLCCDYGFTNPEGMDSARIAYCLLSDERTPFYYL